MLLCYFSQAHGASTGIERRCSVSLAQRAVVQWAVMAVERSTLLVRHSLAVRSERTEGWLERAAMEIAGSVEGSQADAVNTPVATEDVLV